VTGLLRQLWAQPHTAGPFRPLAQMCAAWAEEFQREYAAASAADRIDPGLARAEMALFRALPETADNRVLPCTDLHGGNILAAQRAPWLVIDSKPYLGDPAYDVLQHMLNCEDRLAADPAGLAKRMVGWPGLTPAGSGSGCSPAACRSRLARRSCARWPGGLRPPSPPPAGAHVPGQLAIDVSRCRSCRPGPGGRPD
jgi:hypothetical protein